MTTALPEGTVTLLFTDVEKSTDLRTSRGDETAHALLQRQGDLVRAQIREHSGHEVKTMGDGFMVAFASARAPLHERRLVRALHGGGGACRPRREG